MKAARSHVVLLTALLFVVVLAAPGCSPKGATEMAIKATESSYAGVKDKLEAVMPDEAKAIEAKIADAKANMEKGEYKAALDGIKDVPNEIKDLSGKVEAKAAELKTSWDALAASLPASTSALSAQVDKLAKMKKLPGGLDAAKLDEAKTALANAQQSWTDAQSAQTSGKIAEAVAKADAAKAALDQGMGALGMAAADAGQAAAAAGQAAASGAQDAAKAATGK